ncbi:HIRA-interacting protein 5 [Metschnikowia bicuspidata var. bicuspidata NRRL YB-4993]|uniref:HIRA-interacting protein 5 n=1 Tax=Metschnikowia bicuspidata var. bicuspidata NRRL YB-4993 TaxID=869754 RepID=A0A1A0HJU6_9ASCO|nr:HIRA-interacting protein 5 [Metschnikowia bicuspidata var. bicuspidata NRRL YB-4993]OBA24162.1 HIRA-interacting protein 5 [Metschnikowia bicuspidata var. bicuspidata NRRL YB-4993]
MFSLNHNLAARHALSYIRAGAKARFLSFKTFPTPNANALKFESPVPVSPAGNKTFEFSTTLQAVHSPLALKLFKLAGVKSLMIGSDFITVSKQDYVNWAHLRPEVVEVLDKFLTLKTEPVITRELLEEADSFAASENDSEIVAMIKELIDTRIRPAIQDDGGDIEFKAFDEETGTVFLKLQGACKSCSSSENTLKGGIEAMLKHYIEEVSEVVQILDPEEEIANKEFERLEFKLKNKSQAATDQAPASQAPPT